MRSVDGIVATVCSGEGVGVRLLLCSGRLYSQGEARESRGNEEVLSGIKTAPVGRRTNKGVYLVDIDSRIATRWRLHVLPLTVLEPFLPFFFATCTYIIGVRVWDSADGNYAWVLGLRWVGFGRYHCWSSLVVHRGVLPSVYISGRLVSVTARRDDAVACGWC